MTLIHDPKSGFAFGHKKSSIFFSDMELGKFQAVTIY